MYETKYPIKCLLTSNVAITVRVAANVSIRGASDRAFTFNVNVSDKSSSGASSSKLLSGPCGWAREAWVEGASNGSEPRSVVLGH